MTPERKEEIKRDAQSGQGYEDAYILNHEVLELLAALEEAEQKVVIKQITINTLQENYYEAQQTIARLESELEDMTIDRNIWRSNSTEWDGQEELEEEVEQP